MTSLQNLPIHSQANLQRVSNILNVTILDEVNPMDEKWSQYYQEYVKPLQKPGHMSMVSGANGKDEIKLSAAFVQELNQSVNLKFVQGLIYAYLLSVKKDRMYYITIFRSLESVVICHSQLQILIHERWSKLVKDVKENIMVLVKELWQLGTEGSGTVETLFRFAQPGHLSKETLWLYRELINLLIHNEQFLFKQHRLLQQSVYNVLRTIPFHASMRQDPVIAELLSLEIQFCVKCLRSAFATIFQIGRDLIRLLKYASVVPEISEIYMLLLKSPKVLDPSENFKHVNQILCVPTRKNLLINSIPPEVERQLFFLMTEVKMGNQRRYQAWFTQMHFHNSSNLVMILDIIRFICCVFHPSTQVIQSKCVARWVMLGWFLQLFETPEAKRNPFFKQIMSQLYVTLIYDWLFFSKFDSSKNVEPTILLMHHSIPKYGNITIQLLDTIFLHCAHGAAQNQTPDLDLFCASRDYITSNVRGAMSSILQHKILPNLQVFRDWDKFPQNMQTMFSHMFPPQNRSPAVSPQVAVSPATPKAEVTTPKKNLQNISPDDIQSIFDPHLSTLSKQVSQFHHNSSRINPALIGQAQQSLRNVLQIYESVEKDFLTPLRKEKLAKILMDFISVEWNFQKSISNYETSIASILRSDTLCFTLLSTIHRKISQKNESNGNQEPLSNFKVRYGDLIRYLCQVEPSLGFKILAYCIRRHKPFLNEIQDIIIGLLTKANQLSGVYLKILISKQPLKRGDNEKIFLSFYDWSLVCRGGTDKKNSLCEDLALSIEEDPSLFILVLPIICRYFQNYTRTYEFYEMICRKSYPKLVQEITGLLNTGRLRLFGKSEEFGSLMQDVILKSLSWPYASQNNLWDMMIAEFSFRQTNLSEDLELDICTFIQSLFKDPKFAENNFLNRVLSLLIDTRFANSYHLSKEFVLFLLQQPVQTNEGYFGASLIFNWAYNTYIPNSGLEEILLKINEILDDMFTNSQDYEKSGSTILLQLFQLKSMEIRNKRANLGDTFFQQPRLLRSIRKLRDKNYIHPLLFSNLIQEIPGGENNVSQKRKRDDEPLENEATFLQENLQISPPKTRSQRKTFSLNDDDDDEYSEDDSEDDEPPLKKRKTDAA